MPESEARAPYTVHAIAFQAGELWVAQCLEVDIAAFTGRGLRELVEVLADQLQAAGALAFETRGRLFDRYRAAPAKWWEALSEVQGEPWRSTALRPFVDLRVYPQRSRRGDEERGCGGAGRCTG